MFLRLDIKFLQWDRKLWSLSTWKQNKQFSSQASWFRLSVYSQKNRKWRWQEKSRFFYFKAAVSCKLFKDWKNNKLKTAWKKREELATGRLWKLRCYHVSPAMNPVPFFCLTEQDLSKKQKCDKRATIFTYLVDMIVSDGITSTMTSRPVNKYTPTKERLMQQINIDSCRCD